MPSPIAHSMMGYIVYRVARNSLPQHELRYVGPLPRLLLATIGLSLLPDVDVLPGLLVGSLGSFHNTVAHSLLFGFIVALSIGAMVWVRHRAGFSHWCIIALVCYELHVIMDFFTVGRGVMLLWPLTAERYAAPLMLFYGLHWSEGLLSAKHLWTIMTEGGFVMLIACVIHVLSRKQHSRSART